MIEVRKMDLNWNCFDNNSFSRDNGRNIPIGAWQIDSTPFFGHDSYYNNSDIKKIIFNDTLSSNKKYLSFLSDLKDGRIRLNKYIYQKEFPDFTILFCFDSNAVVALEENEKHLLNIESNVDYCEEELYKLFYLFINGIIVDQSYDEVTKYALLRNSSMMIDHNIDSYMVLPTLHCNARCFYCFENNDEKSNMNAETIEQMGKFIISRSAQKKVVLRWFGGEPLIREDVIDSLSKCLSAHSIDFDAIITTNGSLITDEIIKKMSNDWHIRKVHLTLDGNEAEHNKRKNYKQNSINGYRATINNINKLLSAGLFVVCRLNLDKNNIACLDEIFNELSVHKKNKRFFVHATTLYLPKYSSFSGCYTREEYDEVYTYTFNLMRQYGFIDNIYSVLPDKVVFRCTSCMRNHYVIDPQGNLFKCEQEEKSAEHTVGNIWEGVKYTRHMGYWLDNNLHSDCNDCKFIPICQGGCKWRKSIDNDDLTPCVNTRYQMNAISTFVYDTIKLGLIHSETL